MVLSAAAVTIFGLILKLISAEPSGWFLVPLATAAGICHVVVHARAARAVEPPIRLAAISDVLLFAAILLQIDFGWTYNCGHTTYDGIAWNLGWSSEKARTLIRGVPAFALDLAYFIPVATTWRRLRRFASPAPATAGRKATQRRLRPRAVGESISMGAGSYPPVSLPGHW
jgi:hypothetical protein